MNKYEEQQRRQHLLSLIPKPNELPVPDEIAQKAYDRWLEQTIKDIARQIKRHGSAFHHGEPLIYAYPTLRDMGAGYKLWQAHYQDVVELLSLFYDVKEVDMMHISSNVPGFAISLKKATD